MDVNADEEHTHNLIENEKNVLKMCLQNFCL